VVARILSEQGPALDKCREIQRLNGIETHVSVSCQIQEHRTMCGHTHMRMRREFIGAHGRGPLRQECLVALRTTQGVVRVRWLYQAGPNRLNPWVKLSHAQFPLKSLVSFAAEPSSTIVVFMMCPFHRLPAYMNQRTVTIAKALARVKTGRDGFWTPLKCGTAHAQRWYGNLSTET
jgi:hypothetical protein